MDRKEEKRKKRKKLMKSFNECLQHMNQKTEELAERIHKILHKSAQNEAISDDQQILLDYLNNRIFLSDAVLKAFTASNVIDNPVIIDFVEQGSERIIALIIEALQNDLTNPVLIRLLSRACTRENARFQVEEVAEIYMQACILEQSFEKFTEFVSLFYNTFLKNGFDVLPSLQDDPCFSSEKRDYIDQWIFQRKSTSQKT